MILVSHQVGHEVNLVPFGGIYLVNVTNVISFTTSLSPLAQSPFG